MIHCVIIDDEEQSRVALRSALQTSDTGIQVMAEAGTTIAAIEAINQHCPQLVFLDIQLGDGSGFEVLEKITWKNFKVIFVTAYSEYALEAFRVNAVQYLLKPVENDALTAAVQQCLQAPGFFPRQELPRLLEGADVQKRKVCFPSTEGYNFYTVNEIIRCEADNNYSRLYISDKEQLYLSKTLKEVEEQLSGYGFVRVHKSHLINGQHIRKYLNREGGCLLMSDGAIVPLSQRRKPEILQLISNDFR